MMLMRLSGSRLAARGAARAPLNSFRWLSEYQFDQYSGAAAEKWPVTKANTVLNQCPEGQLAIIERFGKMKSVIEPGWYFAMPLIERIAYVVDTRSRTLEVVMENAATSDKVAVMVSGSCEMSFVDAEKAAYGSRNPLQSVRQTALAEMRTAVSEVTYLDDSLRLKMPEISERIFAKLQAVAPAWGVEVTSFALAEVAPSGRNVADAIDRLAVEERESARALAEAQLAEAASRVHAEARRIAKRQDAETAAEVAIIAAEADAKVAAIRAKAASQAILEVEKVLKTAKSTEAAALVLALHKIANTPAPLLFTSAVDSAPSDDSATDDAAESSSSPAPVAAAPAPASS